MTFSRFFIRLTSDRHPVAERMRQSTRTGRRQPYPLHVSAADPAERPATPSRPRSFVASSHEPDFVLGPLALVAAAAFVRAARRRRPAPLLVGVTALALEFGSPAYKRLKRNPAIPALVAHYPDS